MNSEIFNNIKKIGYNNFYKQIIDGAKDEIKNSNYGSLQDLLGLLSVMNPTESDFEKIEFKEDNLTKLETLNYNSLLLLKYLKDNSLISGNNYESLFIKVVNESENLFKINENTSKYTDLNYIYEDSSDLEQFFLREDKSEYSLEESQIEIVIDMIDSVKNYPNLKKKLTTKFLKHLIKDDNNLESINYFSSFLGNNSLLIDCLFELEYTKEDIIKWLHNQSLNENKLSIFNHIDLFYSAISLETTTGVGDDMEYNYKDFQAEKNLLSSELEKDYMLEIARNLFYGEFFFNPNDYTVNKMHSNMKILQIQNELIANIKIDNNKLMLNDTRGVVQKFLNNHQIKLFTHKAFFLFDLYVANNNLIEYDKGDYDNMLKQISNDTPINYKQLEFKILSYLKGNDIDFLGFMSHEDHKYHLASNYKECCSIITDNMTKQLVLDLNDLELSNKERGLV